MGLCEPDKNISTCRYRCPRSCPLTTTSRAYSLSFRLQRLRTQPQRPGARTTPPPLDRWASCESPEGGPPTQHAHMPSQAAESVEGPPRKSMASVKEYTRKQSRNYQREHQLDRTAPLSFTACWNYHAGSPQEA